MINGTYKERRGKVWCELEVMSKNLYVVVRRRASFLDHCGSLTRYITFIMALYEYNQHNNLRDKNHTSYITHTSLLTILYMVLWKQNQRHVIGKLNIQQEEEYINWTSEL